MTNFVKTFIRPAKPSLKQALANKSADLRLDVDTHASLAETHLKLASDEKLAARVKATHATAVDQAYAILDKAGVDL